MLKSQVASVENFKKMPKNSRFEFGIRYPLSKNFYRKFCHASVPPI